MTTGESSPRLDFLLPRVSSEGSGPDRVLPRSLGRDGERGRVISGSTVPTRRRGGECGYVEPWRPRALCTNGVTGEKGRRETERYQTPSPFLTPPLPVPPRSSRGRAHLYYAPHPDSTNLPPPEDHGGGRPTENVERKSTWPPSRHTSAARAQGGGVSDLPRNWYTDVLRLFSLPEGHVVSGRRIVGVASPHQLSCPASDSASVRARRLDRYPTSFRAETRGVAGVDIRPTRVAPGADFRTH